MTVTKFAFVEDSDVISYGNPQPVPANPMVLKPIEYGTPDKALASLVLSHIKETTGGITIPFCLNMAKVRRLLHSNRINSHE